MSYCRFQNTLLDLQDCFDNWDGAASDEELKAREQLANLCQKVIDEKVDDVDDSDEDDGEEVDDEDEFDGDEVS